MVEAYFDESGLPVVVGVVEFPSLRGLVASQVIRLLVDTSAAASMIAANDVLRLGLLPHLPKFPPDYSVKALGVNGFVSGPSHPAMAKVLLLGHPRHIRFDFGVPPMRPLDLMPPRGLPGELEVPSLLGWDVLQHFVVVSDRGADRFRLYTRNEARRLSSQRA